MIEYKADLNVKNEISDTVLHYASDYKSRSIPFLLELKCDPNAKNTEGDTPFNLFCMYEYDYLLIREFLKHKADPNIKSKNGNSTFLMCCKSDNEDLIISFLIYGADINLKYFEVSKFFFFFSFFY